MLDNVLSKVVEINAQRDPDQVCIIQDDGLRIELGTLESRAGIVASWLLDRGVQPGDRIINLLPNDVTSFYLTLGVSKAGAIEVPVNPGLVGASLRHVLHDVKASFAFVDASLLNKVQEALQGLECKVISYGDANAGTGGAAYEEILAGPERNVRTSAMGSTPGSIMYTSGTTGLPKGAILSHNHAWLMASRTIDFLKFGPDDVMMTVLPLFHAAGKYMDIGGALLAGGRALLMRKYSTQNFWDMAIEHRATASHWATAIVHFLLAQPESDRDRKHSLSRCLAVTSHHARKEFTARFGTRLFDLYGSTESNFVTFNAGGPVGSCGKAIAPLQVKVVDEFDRQLPTGSTGEIVVSSTEPWSTFSGYWNNPEQTVEAIRNYGFHTGDAGYLDENGYLFFVDRIKDMIRRRGENISAQTIEDAVIELPGIAECAAFGLPSDYGDEDVAIAVIPDSSGTFEPAAVRPGCAGKLPDFAHPAYLFIVDALPMTETGKVQKFKLKTLNKAEAVQLENTARKVPA